MSNIFSGMSAADPTEMCDTLGWKNGVSNEELVGALMTLCRTVADQNRRIKELEAAQEKK